MDIEIHLPQFNDLEFLKSSLQIWGSMYLINETQISIQFKGMEVDKPRLETSIQSTLTKRLIDILQYLICIVRPVSF